MNIVSLFSGAGGLDLGLTQAGHSIVWANDNDPKAVETYRANIGKHIICCDIQSVDLQTLPDCDVIVGGFPCQGFSLANRLRSADDDRNTLYKFFYQAISLKKPKFFIAENVKGILSLEKGAAVQKIISDFEAAGYLVSVNLVNMADYGVPQKRQRVIFLGQRKDVADTLLIQLPKPTNAKDGKDGLAPWVSIKEAIDKYGDPSEDSPYMNHICSTYKVVIRDFTAHRRTDPDQPSPTVLARGNGKGGVCAIPHYNGTRRLSIRESAAVQTFPDDFEFHGNLGACYRQIGNAVPVRFGKLLGLELKKLENLS